MLIFEAEASFFFVFFINVKLGKLFDKIFFTLYIEIKTNDSDEILNQASK